MSVSYEFSQKKEKKYTLIGENRFLYFNQNVYRGWASGRGLGLFYFVAPSIFFPTICNMHMSEIGHAVPEIWPWRKTVFFNLFRFSAQKIEVCLFGTAPFSSFWWKPICANKIAIVNVCLANAVFFLTYVKRDYIVFSGNNLIFIHFIF